MLILFTFANNNEKTGVSKIQGWFGSQLEWMLTSRSFNVYWIAE